MDNIVRPDGPTRHYLLSALNYSVEHGTGFRICTGEDATGPWVKWDNGSGWTPPMYGMQV